MWKITAGRANAYISDFLEGGIVGIGWMEAGDYRSVSSRDELMELFAQTWPEHTNRQVQVGAGQVWRFLHEVAVGQNVLTYDPGSRLYHLGEIRGDPQYEPNRMERLPVTRAVQWVARVSRDDLSEGTRNTLGAILTIFKLSPTAEREILEKAGVRSLTERSDESSDPDEVETDPFADIGDQAIERVKDRILSLSWDEVQELVAAMLRAMGYRTSVSASGPDRGRDILASKDGFGFEPPRIVVEVKHRRGAMGAPEIRSFLGGRHSEDRGLYVSTGGFTREAQYEADRATTVTHLMNLDDLARSLVEQYELLDAEGRALLPLKRLYWPA
jgi:restriction system protein